MLRKCLAVISVISTLGVGWAPAMEAASANRAKDKAIAAAVAGSYYFGDGLGVNCSLVLQAGGRFEFAWHGCMGEYDRNTGPYRVENGSVILSPEKPNIREGFRGTPTRFLAVPWGERLYLVPEDKALEFCNEINQGREPRKKLHGMYYIRGGDEKKPAPGRPKLPAKWRAYLLEKPLEGKVIEASGTTGVVNLGRKHGLKTGMVLTDRNDDSRPYVQLRVTEVMERTAKVTTKYTSLNETIKAGEPVFSLFLPPGLLD